MRSGARIAAIAAGVSHATGLRCVRATTDCLR
jgi:hypothetical protein